MNKIRFLAIVLLAAMAWLIPVGCGAHRAPTTSPSVTILPATRPVTQPTIPAHVKKVVARTFPLNVYNRELDGQWQGIGMGSDGNCYFSSATHSPLSSGIFGRYDPRSGRLKILCDDLTKLCGEDLSKTPPQGKIHSEIAECDGWIYFATHVATYWPQALKDYTGGHVLGRNLKTGEFRDLGILKPNYTIYSALAADRDRKILWVLAMTAEEGPPPPRPSTAPGAPPVKDPRLEFGDTRMFQIDLKTGKKKDLGVLARGGINNGTMFCFIDRQGNCWVSLRTRGGTLTRISPAGKIEYLQDVLPVLDAQVSPEPETDPVVQQSRTWGWIIPLDEDRCLFTMAAAKRKGSGTIWMFDSSKPITEAFSAVRFVGPTHVGRALVGNRLYFQQRLDRKPFIRDGWCDDDLHLMSASIGNPNSPIIDHGIIVDQDGRVPWRLTAMATDGKHLFMVGDWKILPGDKGSLKHDRRIRERENRDVFTEADTGEFFAVILLPAQP